MASLGYYLFAFGAGAKYLGNWYLFFLVSGGYTEKGILLLPELRFYAAAIVIRDAKDQVEDRSFRRMLANTIERYLAKKHLPFPEFG